MQPELLPLLSRLLNPRCKKASRHIDYFFRKRVVLKKILPTCFGVNESPTPLAPVSSLLRSVRSNHSSSILQGSLQYHERNSFARGGAKILLRVRGQSRERRAWSNKKTSCREESCKNSRSALLQPDAWNRMKCRGRERTHTNTHTTSGIMFRGRCISPRNAFFCFPAEVLSIGSLVSLQPQFDTPTMLRLAFGLPLFEKGFVVFFY